MDYALCSGLLADWQFVTDLMDRHQGSSFSSHHGPCCKRKDKKKRMRGKSGIVAPSPSRARGPSNYCRLSCLSAPVLDTTVKAFRVSDRTRSLAACRSSTLCHNGGCFFRMTIGDSNDECPESSPESRVTKWTGTTVPPYNLEVGSGTFPTKVRRSTEHGAWSMALQRATGLVK